MAKYLITIEGFDPSALPSTPTNAELLQMVRESQCASDVGELVLSPTAPDVVLYPILKRFRWVKTNLALVPTGEFYFHNGSSWEIEKPSVGSITGDMLVDHTVGIEKLSPDGDPLQIIRINAMGDAFEPIDIVDAIPDAGLSTDKLAAGSGADLALISGLGGSWAPVSLQYFFGRIYSVVSGVTSFSSLADKITFLRTSDNTVRTMTVNYVFGSAIDSATEITGTAAEDYVPLVDFSDGLFKKVLLSNLLPNTGVAAGVYTSISQLTVNTKGQITALTTTGAAGDTIGVKDTGAVGYAPQSVLAAAETVVRLNTIVSASWASLVANVITLAAGTYAIDACIPVYEASGGYKFVGILYNNTSSTVLATGTSRNEGDMDSIVLNIKHVFTLSASSAITLRIHAGDACTIGQVMSVGTYPETYAQALITKLA